MGYYETLAALTGINILLAVGLNVVNGLSGQFSMGHAGFMCIGAYLAGALVTLAGVTSLPLALLLAGLGAGVAGLAVGIPCLRLKGDYLAIVTLGFGEIIRVGVLNIEAIGGARGMTGIPPLAGLGWIYGMAVLGVAIVVGLLRTRAGRAVLAVREDELAAEAVGVPTTQVKVGAFVLGAVLAGWAGALYATTFQYISPGGFDLNRSFEIIIMVVLGGMGSVPGAIMGAVLVTLTREALRPLQQLTGLDLRMVIFSLLLITLMLLRPRGLMGPRKDAAA